MTKILLGVAIGYVFHSAIDKIVSLATSSIDDAPKPSPETAETP
jgi:hypothetical protein